MFTGRGYTFKACFQSIGLFDLDTRREPVVSLSRLSPSLDLGDSQIDATLQLMIVLDGVLSASMQNVFGAESASVGVGRRGALGPARQLGSVSLRGSPQA
ncbi:MAG: hypothetical protein NTY19_24320 [Planctomycetota bacterium]|nr:hypothetical protein [Planctomycetota bacterium]